jgi:hypothetical protein
MLRIKSDTPLRLHSNREQVSGCRRPVERPARDFIA